MLPRDTIHLCGIGISGDDSDGLVILPQGDGQIFGLTRPALTSLLEPPLHMWLQLWGEPFAVCSQCATTIQPISVQIKKEIYTGKVIVKKEMSVGILQVFGKCFYHFCPQPCFNCASLFPSIYLESRNLPIGSFCSCPHLESSSYGFQRHVLLQGGPSLEGNHRLVDTDVLTWLVNSSNTITQDICYWPDLTQSIVVWTPWW